MEAKILVRVVFIGVKCYNERAWEAKLASQALYAKSLKISLRIRVKSPSKWGVQIARMIFKQTSGEEIQAEETGGNLS